MRLSGIFRSKKSRRYPIKRDQQGRSLRARCFERFEQGQRPAAVAMELNMKETTVFRYFTDWKRLGPNFDKQYSFVKQLFKKTAPDRDKSIESYARVLGIEKEQFEAILEKPQGLKQFLAGRLYFPIMVDADHKRHMSLQLGILIAEHLINKGGEFQDVYLALRTLLQKNKRFRQNEEDAIEADNQFMALIHRILELDLENERKGAVKRDRLTEDEIDQLLKSEQESFIKRMEVSYWKNIATLMMEGISREQAREKMYRDLLDNGNVEGAKALRAYQDITDPLKPRRQEPPPSSVQPTLPK